MRRKKQLSVLLIAAMTASALLTGCGDNGKTADGKTVIELVDVYKRQACVYYRGFCTYFP